MCFYTIDAVHRNLASPFATVCFYTGLQGLVRRCMGVGWRRAWDCITEYRMVQMADRLYFVPGQIGARG